MRFGCPQEIFSDRGPNSMSNVIRQYLARLDTNHKRTTAFHPRTNGKCEHQNDILKQMLCKYCSGTIHRWDDFVDTALFAARIRTHRFHGQSPFYYIYGVEPGSPGDGAPPILQDSSRSDLRIQAEFRVKRLDELSRFREAAIKRAEKMLVRPKAEYCLDLDWFGPFVVLQRNLASGIYKLAYPTGNPYRSWVHTDRLTKVTQDNVNAPWVQPASIHTPLRSIPRTLALPASQS